MVLRTIAPFFVAYIFRRFKSFIPKRVREVLTGQSIDWPVIYNIFMEKRLVDSSLEMDSKYREEQSFLLKCKNDELKKVKRFYTIIVIASAAALLVTLFFGNRGINDLFSLLFFGSGGIVYVASGGTGIRYHRSGCSTLWRGSTATTRGEAIGHGKTACLVCSPDSSIVPLIISIVFVAILAFFIFAAVINPWDSKREKSIEKEYEEQSAEAAKKYKEEMLKLLSDRNIISEFNLPPNTSFENGCPIINGLIVSVSQSTPKYHNLGCRYATGRKVHIFDLADTNVPCTVCRPLTVDEVSDDLRRICLLRKKYEQL